MKKTVVLQEAGNPMAGKQVQGRLVVTSAYFVTLYAMFSSYPVLFREPMDHNWDQSGLWVGTAWE
jgi:hypothetical protein